MNTSARPLEPKLYLEDLTPGQVFHAGPMTVDEVEAIAFAKQFDPQPFHVDPHAATSSIFSGLALTGWYTACLSMRLLTRTPLGRIANGLVGVEVRSMRFPRPARPGCTLRFTVEVLETRASMSRPGWGTAVVRWVTRSDDHETPVLELENVLWVAARGNPPDEHSNT